MKFFVFSALVIAAPISIATTEASFICSINKSESFMIYPKSKKVIHSIFMQSEVELKLTAFETFRCPGCYAFEGTAEGKKYSATVSGRITNSGLEQTMAYKIDGIDQPNIFCFDSKK